MPIILIKQKTIPMLINLSNHPSTLWSEVQITSAKARYNEVTDMAFPNIDPKWTSEQVAELAREYAAKIIEQKPQVVHLMGEMTFTHHLVNLLQAEGITCVASSSERKVIEEKDGKKTVVFDFQQFREYL